MNLNILNNLVSILLTQKIGDNTFALIAQGKDHQNGAILKISPQGVFEFLNPAITLADEEDQKTQFSFAIAEFLKEQTEKIEEEIANLEEIVSSIKSKIEDLQELDCMDSWDDIEDSQYRHIECAVDDLRTILDNVSKTIAEKTEAIKKMKGQI